jgi:hypothetical protein
MVAEDGRSHATVIRHTSYVVRHTT